MRPPSVSTEAEKRLAAPSHNDRPQCRRAFPWAAGIGDDRAPVTLPMGLLYERAAIAFGSGVAGESGSADATDLGGRNAAIEGWLESGF